MTPTLITTRPAAQSESFARDLLARSETPLHIIQSPLIEIVFVDVTLDQPSAVIFTSANGVAAARSLDLPSGLPAWCVGGRTAEAANDAGFDAIEGPGTADGLIAHIIAARPIGTLAHIRGKHARGDVSQNLNAAGLRCVDVVAYNQREIQLTSEALDALNGDSPVIFPLFSPRTAHILSRQGPFAAPIAVVAISEAVQDALDLPHAEVAVVADEPNASAMISATLAVIERLVTHT